MNLAMEDRPVLYVSGPMTGMPDWNYPAFRACAKALEAEGWSVIDPSLYFGGRQDMPRHKYLASDVLALIRLCKGIVLLDGWQNSEGAKLEAQIALDLGYRLFHWTPASGLAPVSHEGIEGVLDA